MVQLFGCLSAGYLGLMVGPKGGSSATCGKPLNKYIDRTNLIAYANFAPSLGADLYAQPVAPTMSNVAQIANITAKGKMGPSKDYPHPP